jgi:hypothetical protein
MVHLKVLKELKLNLKDGDLCGESSLRVNPPLLKIKKEGN